MNPPTLSTRWCRLERIWADGGYEDLVSWVKRHGGWTSEIVRRPKDAWALSSCHLVRIVPYLPRCFHHQFQVGALRKQDGWGKTICC
jgi:hypothetical protein